jgi:peroxiredoxin
VSSRVGAWLIGAAVAAAAGFAIWMGPSVPAPLASGSAAPSLELERLGGGRASLEALRGRVVLINFWATWCKPCEDEMPAMERLYRTLAGPDFELLAVSVDERRDEVEAFRERLGLSFPILLDPERRAAGAYQTFRFPESLVVDRRGRVVERYVGPKDWDAAPYVARLRDLIATSAG